MTPAPLTIGAYNVLLSKEFHLFVMRVFAHLHPGAPPLDAWYVKALCATLAGVIDGDTTRLIVMMPPRTLKSIVVSVALPAFLIGLNPALSVICVSYSIDLAAELGRKFRRIVLAPWYRAAFPAMQIDPRKSGETLIETTAGGMRLAVSVGGTLTGRGADLIVIDDPIKAKDAASLAALEAVLEWYVSTLVTRLNDPVTGRIVVVMQRLHKWDLAGHLMEQGGWKTLRLPAIADCDQVLPLGYGRTKVFRRGELLDPVRLPQALLDQRRREMGSQLFEAQYLQNPVPPDGSIIHRSWLRGFDPKALVHGSSLRIQSWDIANKPGFGNDYCCCTTAVEIGGRLYIIDRERFQAEFPDLRRRVLAAAARHRPSAILIEDAGSGTGLIQDLRDSGLNIIPVRPERDKQSRAIHAGATFEAGNILFDKSACWYPDLERELLEFPHGRHDDQVDSLTQLILWWRERGGPRVWPTDLCQPDADGEIYGEEGYMPPFFLNLPRRD